MPDSVFPRDWFSTHRDEHAYPGGLLVTYPMKTPSREAEKNPTVLSQLAEQYAHRADIQATDGAVLEGAGTLVFDRADTEHTVWCSMSTRADKSKLDEFVNLYNTMKSSQAPDLKVVPFEAFDANQEPIYHTDVMCSVLRDHVMICLDSIKPEPFEPIYGSDIKSKILSHVGDKTLMQISQEEVSNFCGNVLMLTNSDDEQVLVMSEQARESYSKKNMDMLKESYKNIVSSDISTISGIGGGSVRCMIAELF